MTKIIAQRRKRCNERASLIHKTARLRGVSNRYVRYVLAGDRNNEAVLETYMELMEGEQRLVQAVAQMLPLPTTQTA